MYPSIDDADRRPYRRRSAPAALFVLGAAGLLAVELAVAVAVGPADGDTVAGYALAPEESVPAVAAPPPAPTSAPVPATSAPVAPAPLPPSSSPAPSVAPARAAPHGQRPGTIRLPAGGTATLVRKEVQGPNALLPVPENLGEATWWGAGLDAPTGASVFAGHVNWQGRNGPFAELWGSRVGEEVSVADAAGSTWNYRISQVFTLGKDELPAKADALFGQSGPHRIVLVTCGGRWLGGSTGYAENRVIVADPA